MKNRRKTKTGQKVKEQMENTETGKEEEEKKKKKQEEKRDEEKGRKSK